jgi:hypothetical protein
LGDFQGKSTVVFVLGSHPDFRSLFDNLLAYGMNAGIE